jgi:hypothetical protein
MGTIHKSDTAFAGKYYLLFLLILLTKTVVSPAQNTSSEASDTPGKWDYHYYTESGKGGYRSELNYSLTPAELAKFKQKIDAVVEFLHQDPVTKNPIGFEPTVQGSVWTNAYEVNYNPALLKDKIPQAEIVLQFCPYYKNAKTGKISKGCIEVSHFDVLLNNMKSSTTTYQNYSGDGYNKDINKASKDLNLIFQSPNILKKIAPGVTAYDNGIVVIADPDKPYWIPVTVGEYFDLELKYWELSSIKEGNTFVLDYVKKDFAAFSPEDLNKIAYVGCPNDQCLTLVTTTVSEKMWMRFNPDYFDKSLPRSAVQLITVRTLPEAFVKEEGEYENTDYAKHFKFSKQLDFGKMSQLLDIP